MAPEHIVIVVGASAALLGGAALLFGRRRVRRQRAVGRSPVGYGAALAQALDGRLDDAADRLEALLRAGGVDLADTAVGLVAVHRAAGRLASAEAILERLARRGHQGAWLGALRLRVALDRGDLDGAARLVAEQPRLPTDLCIAALARAGRWAEASRLYRERVPRRERDPAIESALLAGAALAEAGTGNLRAARRTLKRTRAEADGLLELLARAWIHPKPDERRKAAATLRPRLGADAGTLLPGVGIEQDQGEAHASAETDIEVKLGELRDAIERDPEDWRARRAYVECVLEHGRPEDWRHELAELVEFVAPVAPPPALRRCGACGHELPSAVFICPRCDALGSLEPAPATGASSPRPAPSVEGANVSDLLVNLRRFGGDRNG